MRHRLHRLQRRYLVVGLCLLTFLVASGTVLSQKVSAGGPVGYFTGSTAVCFYHSGACRGVPYYADNDVLTGRDTSGGGQALPAGAYDTKAHFIAYMEAELTSSNPQEKTGAAFIINGMVRAGTAGNPAKTRAPSLAMQADFAARVNSPGVAMTIVTTSPNDYSDSTSFYDASHNDDFYENYTSSSRDLVLFVDSAGSVLYVIEIPCGNPLGGLAGLPAPPWSISGKSTVRNVTTGGAAATAINVYQNQTVQFIHTITNAGPGAAINFAKNVYTYNPSEVQITATTFSTLTSGASVTMTNNVLIPWDAVIGSTYCEGSGYSPYNSAGAKDGRSNHACVTVVASPISCDSGANLSLSRTPLEAGDPVTFNMTLSYPGANPQTLLYSSATPGLVLPGSSPTSHATTGGTYTISGIVVPAAADRYTVNWTVSGAGSQCSRTFDIFDLPYFSAYNAGVRAGGEFKSVGAKDCVSPDPLDGELGGWYNNTGATHYGASTQLSALAMVKIVGFASAQVGLAGGSGLTFANDTTKIPATDFTTSSTSPSLGGDFSLGSPSKQWCLTEYDKPTTPAPTVIPSAPVAPMTRVVINNLPGIGSSKKSVYSYTGAKPFWLDGVINPKQNASIFVEGDVYIDSDITYGNAATGWALTDVPSFVLVVTGNIYIDNSVSRLDGLYIARNDASGKKGQIFTCTDGFAAVATSDLYSQCNQQLLVNGSFVADQINLLRTYGTLRNGATVAPGSCANAGSGPPVYNSCAAEVFELSPEMYLSQPAVQPSGNTSVQYNSITSLPPVL